ncbi:MAG: dihydroneopterin aldolase [Anaerolineaceae bacterium]|nr:dihydroneopterin aldolase [Anaerolineaceae bacterium]
MDISAYDTIIITDLVACGIIGVKHPERDNPQDLLLNIVFYKDLRQVGHTDDINDTVNYSAASKLIIAEVAVCAFHTVEALAAHLVNLLLRTYPIDAVRVRVEKPKKVSQTSRVGAEIYRAK